MPTLTDVPLAEVPRAAASPTDEVVRMLGVDPATGLTSADVARRAAAYGANTVSSHRVRFLSVLARQVDSPLLWLLVATATASFFVGERSDAVIICVIVCLSVGLGLGNEWRAERAAEALHDQIRHDCVVVRDGAAGVVNVVELVPGDLVRLQLGEVVPADIRLIDVTGLACDESVLTGEALPVDKQSEPVPAGAELAELASIALMGTVVHAGSATGVVVATGRRTAFGGIAAGLSTHPLDTEFQIGLRRFSMLLVQIGLSLTAAIFVINVVLHRPVIDALLFSLAIAVGITPQLLPAVVSTSLAAGSRSLGRRKVLVKRLVCIEDLGNVDVLFTDKTGTLTAGRIEYMRCVPVPGVGARDVLTWALLCTEVDVRDRSGVGGNPLDQALWASPATAALRPDVARWARAGVLPFDHERMLVSTVVTDPGGRTMLLTKGAPEAVLPRCARVPGSVERALRAEFEAGNRVIALATRVLPSARPPAASDERELCLAGFLVFLDPPKTGAARSLARLAALGIDVKIVTGDNPLVARKVCRDLGMRDAGTLTGAQLATLDDEQLIAALPNTTVFARVSPEDKARIVRLQRRGGGGVAFLGDGVNDALALHAADVGISVDTATDVAKDAADVILLEKDLDVLADGVAEGRRIFANTIKYVLMGTSSNFGNMFSAAGASLVLSFLPMLPGQILLNNLLYDTSQLAIPTDHVDADQLHRPSHWDLGFIRRFMIVFGPLSSVFDFVTFAVMLRVFHAGAAEFRSGWFVESLATQTLVVFAIRTRRVPFFRSRPSLPLALAALGVVTVGALLPATPLKSSLGFATLPIGFFATLVLMIVGYLALIEVGKRWFYRVARPTAPGRRDEHRRHVLRRAARFSAGSTDPRLAPRRAGLRLPSGESDQ